MDIALQHSDNTMLKKMRRNITCEETWQLIDKIREEVPGIHLRTTMMVGFPGETDEHFRHLIDFVERVRFDRLGAFPYSEEEGTYSAIHYKDRIPEKVKQERFDELMSVQEKIAFELNELKVGKELKVIIDREESDFYVGRTEYDSPEVDSEVLIAKEKKLEPGQFYQTLITGTQSFDLIGKVR